MLQVTNALLKLLISLKKKLSFWIGIRFPLSLNSQVAFFIFKHLLWKGPCLCELDNVLSATS